ncbi:MAG: hypothetical protein AAGA56_06155, partial [Myxococcota bacterium]
DELLAVEVDGPLDGDGVRRIVPEVDELGVADLKKRLSQLKDELDGKAVEKLLRRARKAGRSAIEKAKKDTGKEPEGDWLTFVLSLAESQRQDWRDAAELFGTLRLLESIGTTEAIRVMIDAYSSFGQLVRIDLQRAMARLDHRAVAALIEAKQHDARRVRIWARKELDRLGRSVPGESVSTTDLVILADVLRAFGYVKDLDATRILLSYVGHERQSLRAAARQGVVAIGKAASWHLKDVYNQEAEKKPPRDWDHRKVAQELFRHYDQQRLEPILERWRRGTAAAAENRWADAAAAFDEVLARDPLFPRRETMAATYLERGLELARDPAQAEAAMIALRKGLRLRVHEAEPSPKHEAELLFLEASALAAQGTPDPFLLARVLELNPDHREAKQLLDSLDGEIEKRADGDRRELLAGSIGAGAVVLLLLLAFVGRAKPEGGPTAPEDGGSVKPPEDDGTSVDTPEPAAADGLPPGEEKETR